MVEATFWENGFFGKEEKWSVRPEKFVRSNRSPRCHEARGRTGPGHPVCTEAAVRAPPAVPWPGPDGLTLLTAEASPGPPRNRALLGIWPARRSARAAVGPGLACCLVLQALPSASPCLHPGGVTDGAQPRNALQFRARL